MWNPIKWIVGFLIELVEEDEIVIDYEVKLLREKYERNHRD